MKVNELRIRNLILQHTYRNGKCNVVRSLSAIKKEGGLSINIINENRTLSKHPIEWFSPIPLTEEWLISFGFEKRKSDYEHAECYDFYKDGFYYCSSDSYWELFNCRIKDIDYVHQLQNLYFALTGEELVCV